MQVFQIGQVSQKTGLTVDAIRFYEKQGLLPRPLGAKVDIGSIKNARSPIWNSFERLSSLAFR